MIHEYSRRRFLIAGGATALAIPLMESLGPRSAKAEKENAEDNRRFVVMNSPNGVNRKFWTPTGEGAAINFGETLTDSFEPIREHITFLELDCQAAKDSPGDPHGVGMGAMLSGIRLLEGDEFVHGANDKLTSGWGGGVSVDQKLAQLGAGKAQFDSLDFSIENHPANVWTRMSYSDSGEPVTPEASPQAAFDRVFGSFLEDPAELQKKRKRRLSILDGVRQEVASIAPQLSAGDRLRLEEHVTVIRELEKSVENLGAMTPAGCGLPERPSLGLGGEIPRLPGEPHRDVEKPEADKEVPARHEAFRTLMVRALACDLTRVATLMSAPGNSYIVLSWTGVTTPHHALSHKGADERRADKKLIDAWYASQFAELVKAMAAVTEPNGKTLLDNSVALYTSEIGDNNGHNYDRKHHVLAGHLGGTIAGGKRVQHPVGTRVNALYVSIINGMGYEEVNQFGGTEYGSGPLSGLG